MIDKQLSKKILTIFRKYYIWFYAFYLGIFIVLNYFLEDIVGLFTTVSEDFYFDGASIYVVYNTIIGIFILTLCTYIYLYKRSFMFLIPRKDFLVTFMTSLLIFNVIIIATEVLFSFIMGAMLEPLEYVNVFITINYVCALTIFMCILIPYIYHRFTLKHSVFIYIGLGVTVTLVIPILLVGLSNLAPSIGETVQKFYAELVLFDVNVGVNNEDVNKVSYFIITPKIIAIVPVLFGIKKLYLTAEY